MAAKRVAKAKNKKSLLNNDSMTGFTIIEVVLVLAIAGLIFMMVFIALPQLQRAQRDTQRTQDMSQLAGAITNYQSNNNGKLPDGTCDVGDDDTIATLDGFVSDSKACKLIRNNLLGVDASTNTFVDPLQGDPYKLKISELGGETDYTSVGSSEGDEYGHIVMYTKAACNNEENKVVTTNNKRDYVFVYKSEQNGWTCRAGSR